MPWAYATASDEDLSRAWQAGDSGAGSALVSRHHPAVRRFLQRRLGTDTDDTAQDVWTVVSRTIHRYERRSSFRTWVFGIANNHVRVAHRTQDRSRRIQALAQDLLGPPGDDLCDLYARREDLDRLVSGLLELPQPLQRVLALYYFEQRPAIEIGRRLRIPENTVRSRVRRARELLGEALGAPPSRACAPLAPRACARAPRACARLAPRACARPASDPFHAWLASVDLGVLPPPRPPGRLRFS